MTQPNTIRINKRLAIPLAELELRASRSGGPGGQHANTSATRIQLFWNVRESPSLSERRRQLILSRLASRIDSDGVLQLASQTHRSQHRNRQDVLDRFADLVADALRTAPKRKPTRPTPTSREKRLKSKKHRGRIKRLRGRVRPDD